MATVTARPASVFRSSAFARFYAGQTFSYLGDGLRTLAVPLLVFHLTRSATAVGWTWGLEFFPYAVVSLVAGSLGDRSRPAAAHADVRHAALHRDGAVHGALRDRPSHALDDLCGRVRARRRRLDVPRRADRVDSVPARTGPHERRGRSAAGDGTKRQPRRTADRRHAVRAVRTAAGACDQRAHVSHVAGRDRVGAHVRSRCARRDAVAAPDRRRHRHRLALSVRGPHDDAALARGLRVQFRRHDRLRRAHPVFQARVLGRAIRSSAWRSGASPRALRSVRTSPAARTGRSVRPSSS